jgi:translation initiation factor IF-3
MKKYNINKSIKHPEVRITGNNIKSRIVTIQEALSIANKMNLDLVEIVPTSNPPVCKIIDFNKFLYEKKHKEKENKKNTKKTKIKEIRLTYNTGEHDLNFKLKHAKNFLTKGNKLKISVWFSGREIQFVDTGKLLLLKFVDNLSDFGVPENMPKLENRRMFVFLNPIKKN